MLLQILLQPKLFGLVKMNFGIVHACHQGFIQKGVQSSYGCPFLKKYSENSIKISYNFMGKHAFCMASFQSLAKSLLATAFP